MTVIIINNILHFMLNIFKLQNMNAITSINVYKI